MKQLMNLPLTAIAADEYRDLAADCRALGLQGLEGVWGGEDFSPDRVDAALRVGYHLTFWPDWLDFWLGDEEALTRKFGSRRAWTSFYGGENGRETLMAAYRADLERAIRWGAEYVVFHVSDVSLEEGYTYRWAHTDDAVLDAAAEVINLLLDGVAPIFAFLVENQWWPGLTLADRGRAERFLARLRYPDKGFVLDTGHLMNLNPDLTDEAGAIAWIHSVLDDLGPLTASIRAVHLHRSLSGAYIKAHTGRLPVGWTEEPDYLRKFGISYGHVLRIDPHLPFTCPDVAGLVARIAPQWLTHELSAPNRAAREQALRTQLRALGR